MEAQPVLFIQGAGDMWHPEGSGHLANYLGDQLGSGYAVRAPEMPDADTDPQYEAWAGRIDQELGAVEDDGPGVILVGHSLGGSVLLRYLSEQSPERSIRGVFLASVPYWGSEGWNMPEYGPHEGFGSKLPSVPIFMYHSVSDPEVPIEHLKLYEERIPGVTLRRVRRSDHSLVSGLPEMVEDIRSLG